MVRISPYRLKPEAFEKVFNVFYEVLGNNRDKKEFNNILFDLLSPAERMMIAKRIAIIFLLMKNIDYRTISEVLKVSTTTVFKFRLLMENSKGLVPALRQIVMNDKVILAFKELFSDLFPPGVPGVNWKAAWERKIKIIQEKTEGI